MKGIILLILLTLFGQYLFAQNVVDKNADTTVVSFGEHAPEYPGGMGALQEFLANNLRFPGVCSDLNGRIMMKFVIEKDGRLTNIEFLKPICAELKEEVLKMMNAMPKWIPASQDGILVRYYYALPIVACFLHDKK